MSFCLALAALPLSAAGDKDALPALVPVGDADNKADHTGFGAVAYEYRIGKHEVTNEEFCAFLNAAAKSDPRHLYDGRMESAEYGGIARNGGDGNYVYSVKDGMAKKPVNYVTWETAIRYANWLTNGQGKGDTEKGAYTIDGNDVNLPDHAALAAGKNVVWALPTENEWYKAAYYDPKKNDSGGYWTFATRSDSDTNVNINTNAPSDAGGFAASAYGTHDQNGNMWEWNEHRANGKVGLRGGSFYLNDNANYLRAATRYDVLSAKWPNYGFRVVALGTGDPAAGKTVKPNPTPTQPKTKPGPSVTAPKTKLPPTTVTPPLRPRPGTPAKAPAIPKATGTVYHVSASSGNDEGAGTAESTAWKTLARASQQDLKPGDQILLKAGDTWDEELKPKGNGTPTNPIVIGYYGQGEKPLINRQDFKQDRTGIRLSDQEGFKIVGIEFANCMTGIYADYAEGSPTRKYIWIEDCLFRDSLLYQPYQDYPKRKVGLGICFFSHERKNNIVLADITIKNCVFRRLTSGVWTNSPDNFNKNASNIYNFGNMTMQGCLFEEGYQWQMGIRGVAGGLVRDCVTIDVGRNFRSFNGVAGAMFFRCKDWLFEDSEWGFVSIGLGSGDGEAFDFEGNCDNMTMRNCIFHDTDGPGFLLCCYASDGHPHKKILMENCLINGKSKRPIGLPRCAIVNTTDWNEATWKNCRFYLSNGEALMKVMDPEKDKRSTFTDCLVKPLSSACSTANLAPKARATASSQETGYEATNANDAKPGTTWKAASAEEQWLQLDFPAPARINEFKLREEASSSIARYAIECWDAKTGRWVQCFNGMEIGAEFVAPIIERTTTKVRLQIIRTNKDAPAIAEFEAYLDTTGGIPHDAGGNLTRK